MPERTTGKQRETLALLRAANAHHDSCLSAYELAYFSGARSGVISEGERIHARLKTCERKGWVERVGVTMTNARTWRLTEAGTAALEAP